MLVKINTKVKLRQLVSLVRTTAVFRRTNAKLFDPRGDGWWTQRYNRHRISSRREFFLPSENVRDIFSSRRLDLLVHGESSTRYDFEPLIGLQKKCHDLELAHQSLLSQLSEANARHKELESARIAAEAALLEGRKAVEALRMKQNQWWGIVSLAARKARGKTN